jgi:hypothetical protein
MHAGSFNLFSRTDPLTSSECAAKSLFQKILAISPCGSRFCADTGLSQPCKSLRMNILWIMKKKNIEASSFWWDWDLGGRKQVPPLRRRVRSGSGRNDNVGKHFER